MARKPTAAQQAALDALDADIDRMKALAQNLAKGNPALEAELRSVIGDSSEEQS